ncbi:MAG TPA: hypothetical protein VFD82_13685 [Planctomycetota bacterium]|nr:hypothetical protein [Planctomycetota bacterium]
MFPIAPARFAASNNDMIHNTNENSLDLSGVVGVNPPAQPRHGTYVVAERHSPRGEGWSEYRLVPDGEDASTCHKAHTGYVAVDRKLDLWNILDRLVANRTRVTVTWPRSVQAQ